VRENASNELQQTGVATSIPQHDGPEYLCGNGSENRLEKLQQIATPEVRKRAR
jgi:hypothetical protein